MGCISLLTYQDPLGKYLFGSKNVHNEISLRWIVGHRIKSLDVNWQMERIRIGYHLVDTL